MLINMFKLKFSLITTSVNDNQRGDIKTKNLYKKVYLKFF